MVALGAAALLLAYALVAVWILADHPTPGGGPLSATISMDGAAVTVSGELPSTSTRDDLFEALADLGDITVIVSEVTIMPELASPESIDDLADALLATLVPSIGQDGQRGG